MPVTFKTADGKVSYTPTQKDMLYLGVAAYGETHGSHQVDEWGDMMWVWLNRFMLIKNRTKFPTLASMVSAHSQPVNPIWRRTGSKCTSGDSPSNCTENNLQWRDKMKGFLDREEIPSSVKSTVEAFVEGGICPTRGGPWLDFAANTVAKKYGTQLNAQNWFLNLKQLERSTLMKAFSTSRVVGYKTPCISLLGGLLWAAIIGLGLYFWRKKR